MRRLCGLPLGSVKCCLRFGRHFLRRVRPAPRQHQREQAGNARRILAAATCEPARTRSTCSSSPVGGSTVKWVAGSRFAPAGRYDPQGRVKSGPARQLPQDRAPYRIGQCVERLLQGHRRQIGVHQAPLHSLPPCSMTTYSGICSMLIVQWHVFDQHLTQEANHDDGGVVTGPAAARARHRGGAGRTGATV